MPAQPCRYKFILSAQPVPHESGGTVKYESGDQVRSVTAAQMIDAAFDHTLAFALRRQSAEHLGMLGLRYRQIKVSLKLLFAIIVMRMIDTRFGSV